MCPLVRTPIGRPSARLVRTWHWYGAQPKPWLNDTPRKGVSNANAAKPAGTLISSKKSFVEWWIWRKSDAIALADGLVRELLLGGFQLLQAGDIGPCFGEP